jgi:hypothetical protein
LGWDRIFTFSVLGFLTTSSENPSEDGISHLPLEASVIEDRQDDRFSPKEFNRRHVCDNSFRAPDIGIGEISPINKLNIAWKQNFDVYGLNH